MISIIYSIYKGQQQALERKEGMRFLNIIPDWFLTKVHNLGFKIIGVDIEFSSDLGKKVISSAKNGQNSKEKKTDYQVNVVAKRREAMAQNIITNFTNKTCQKAIFIVGNAHLGHSYWQKKVVQDFLEEAGMAFHVLPEWLFLK